MGGGEGRRPSSYALLPVLFIKEKNIISIAICFLFQIKSILGQKYVPHFTTLASPSVWMWPPLWVAAAAAVVRPPSTLRAGQGVRPWAASCSDEPKGGS